MLDTNSLPPTPLLQHHPAYLSTLAAMGVPCGTAWTSDGTAAPWVMRRVGPMRLLWLPLGPLWPTPRAQAYIALRRSLPPHNLCLTGTLDAATARMIRATGAVPIMTGGCNAVVELTTPISDLRRALHGKWRNRLKSSEQAGLCIHDAPLDPAAHHPLLRAELDQRAARRYHALPARFTQTWASQHPDLMRIFTANLAGETIAFIIILMHPPGATYHIGWASSHARQCNAHNLLIWQAMIWLAAKGYTQLDLGTLDTDNAPGLARFKLGTGAGIHPMGPTLLHLPRFTAHRRRPGFCP